jgi:hypothetical protein
MRSCYLASEVVRLILVAEIEVGSVGQGQVTRLGSTLWPANDSLQSKTSRKKHSIVYRYEPAPTFVLTAPKVTELCLHLSKRCIHDVEMMAYLDECADSRPG